MASADHAPLADKPLRVLHVCETARGGVGTYINALLSSNRFNQEVVVPFEHEGMLTNASTKHTFRRTGRNFTSLVRFVKKTISVVRHSKFDVIFCHSSFSIVAVAILRLLKPKLPIIYCAHGWASTRETHWVTNSLVASVEASLSALPTVNLSVSKSEMRHAENLGFRGKHVVIENGVRDAKTPVTSEVREHNDGIDLVFVGRHDKQKGLDLLLEAFSDARIVREDIRLRVVGASVVDDGSQHRPTTAGITYIGWVDDNDIDALFRTADVCIVPSRWEAFGLVVAEAYRNSCPVIVSDRGALPEMVMEGQTGYVFKQSVSGISEQLKSLEKNDLSRMGRNCRRLYEERFTLKRQQKQIEELYYAVYKQGPEK